MDAKIKEPLRAEEIEREKEKQENYEDIQSNFLPTLNLRKLHPNCQQCQHKNNAAGPLAHTNNT